jgi:hypothetical protein
VTVAAVLDRQETISNRDTVDDLASAVGHRAELFRHREWLWCNRVSPSLRPWCKCGRMPTPRAADWTRWPAT